MSTKMEPRETKLWLDQGEFLAGLIEAALADPEIEACWNYISDKLLPVMKRSPVFPAETEIHVMAAPLVKLILERVPGLEHAYGPGVGPLLIGLMGQQIKAVAQEIDIAIPHVNMDRLLPDNPIRVSHDPSTGEPSFSNIRAARLKHFSQMQSYARSLVPPGRRGRPPVPPRPPRSGRRSVSPEESIRAYEMDSRGKKVREIAKALWPSMKPAELRSEKTRLRVRYLIERGGRTARKKPGTKS